MEMDMTVVITGKCKADLVNLQEMIRSKTHDGETCIDLDKIIHHPKDLHPLSLDRNSWTPKDWEMAHENMAKCGSESAYFWKVDNWGTGHDIVKAKGLLDTDVVYDAVHDYWKMVLSMDEPILPVLEKLANLVTSLDFVCTLYERDGAASRHYEYRLKRAFYTSLYQESDVTGMEYEERESADGDKVVTRNVPGEMAEETEPVESAHGDYEDVEIPM